MTLNNLIRLASSAYPDNYPASTYWDFRKSCAKNPTCGGDTLALFIARELLDTYDPKASSEEQAFEAVRALERARRDLGAVIKCLEEVKE